MAVAEYLSNGYSITSIHNTANIEWHSGIFFVDRAGFLNPALLGYNLLIYKISVYDSVLYMQKPAFPAWITPFLRQKHISLPGKCDFGKVGGTENGILTAFFRISGQLQIAAKRPGCIERQLSSQKKNAGQ